MAVSAVLDTNVLVSSLVAPTGPPRQILDAWLEEGFTLVTLLHLVKQLAHVLAYPRIAKRLRVDEAELAALLAAPLSREHVVPGQLHLPGVTRDPKDDAVVACALEGEADYIVSGDQDLLTLGEFRGVHIFIPREFVEILVSYDQKLPKSHYAEN